MFGRRKRKEQEAAPADPEEFVDDLDEEDRAYEDALLLAELEEQERRPAAPPRPQGPWDAADAPEDDVARIDLGGMLVPVPADTEVRVEVSEDGTVVAATLVQGEASVQVNVFAAPRSEGIWGEVLDEIATSLAGSGGSAQRVDGPHGPELAATVPTQAPGSGNIVMSRVRFAGVDGPRWFLRALYAGTAGTDPAAAAPLEEAVRGVVVVRGSEPMAVRDPIPLRLPPQQAPAAEQAPEEPAAEADGSAGLAMPERGPEITETR